MRDETANEENRYHYLNSTTAVSLLKRTMKWTKLLFITVSQAKTGSLLLQGSCSDDNNVAVPCMWSEHPLKKKKKLNAIFVLHRSLRCKSSGRLKRWSFTSPLIPRRGRKPSGELASITGDPPPPFPLVYPPQQSSRYFKCSFWQ